MATTQERDDEATTCVEFIGCNQLGFIYNLLVKDKNKTQLRLLILNNCVLFILFF
jgi:hypothetical protein